MNKKNSRESDLLSKREFLIQMRAHINNKYGTYENCAACHKYVNGISYLSHMCSGNKPPTQIMLADMGFIEIKTTIRNGDAIEVTYAYKPKE